MPTKYENNDSNSTTPPIEFGNGEKDSLASIESTKTVELNLSQPSSVSILTTAPVSLASLTSNSSDATVIRSRDANGVNSDSSSGSATTANHNFSNGEQNTESNSKIDRSASSMSKVKIVSDNLADNRNTSNVQLGDYIIIECIGGGGMGRVYRALDSKLDRYVALKVLAPNQTSDEFRTRFIIEAKASARLHHDNIVTVYSFGESNGLTYLAMEYIAGVNIRDIVTKNGPLPVEDVLSYAIQLASALEHINEKGIVHRDIKPSNVLITDDGTVKVIDLGLAKNNAEQADDLTATGVTLGTFDYISPEQARDPRNVDIRADIYSLGCSLFFMLTGQPPFPNGTGLQKLLSHQGDNAPNVQQFRSDVPDRLADIIMKCMAKNADLRFQTPQDLSKALFIAAEEWGMRPMGISLAKWRLPSISRIKLWKERLSWLIPILILIFTVIVLDSAWKPDEKQQEFLADSPGLKRDVVTSDLSPAKYKNSMFGSYSKFRPAVPAAEKTEESTTKTTTEIGSNVVPPKSPANETPGSKDDGIKPNSQITEKSPKTAPLENVPLPTEDVASPPLTEALSEDAATEKPASNLFQSESENIIPSISIETD